MGIAQLLGKFFGTKSDKDIKEIMPIVETIKKEYDRISKYSNDELRAETMQVKKRISDFVKAEEDEIAELRLKAENVSIEESEAIYDQIDKLTVSVDEKLENILNQVLPVAFAIVKETARRFVETEWVEVTASDYDRDLAALYDHVEIKGEKAYWHNRWIAGGNEITWDMVHYDVQLIGGMVLHDGKIAEMATGEGKTLVATLPAYLNGLSGLGVHVVTVNDYLARRDAEWIGPIMEFLLLTIIAICET